MVVVATGSEDDRASAAGCRALREDRSRCPGFWSRTESSSVVPFMDTALVHSPCRAKGAPERTVGRADAGSFRPGVRMRRGQVPAVSEGVRTARGPRRYRTALRPAAARMAAAMFRPSYYRRHVVFHDPGALQTSLPVVKWQDGGPERGSECRWLTPAVRGNLERRLWRGVVGYRGRERRALAGREAPSQDRKSTRLNSSHGYISYAVFCLKK